MKSQVDSMIAESIGSFTWLRVMFLAAIKILNAPVAVT
jgi:hypothetical protein